MRKSRHSVSPPFLVALVLLGVLGGADALPAQPASVPASVRVVETFDPETGERSRELVGRLTADEILAIQERLRTRGHLEGFERGVLDEATRAALREFQAARGLEVCGCPTYRTVLDLGLEPHVVLTRLVGTEERETTAPQVEVVYPSTPSAPPPPPASDTARSETLERLLEKISARDASAGFPLRDPHPVLWLPFVQRRPDLEPSDLFDRGSGVSDRLLGPSPPGLRPAPPLRTPLPPIRPPGRDGGRGTSERGR